MLLNAYEIEKYCQVSAAKGNLRVQWEDKEEPRTDGKTVFLPRIKMSTTAEDAKKLMWYTTHEAAHNVYSNFELINEKAVDVRKSEMSSIFNQLEDDNIDYLNGDAFRGDKQLCSDQVSDIMGRLRKKAEAAKAAGVEKKMGQEKWDNIMARLAFEANYRSDYCTGTAHLEEEFSKLIGTEKGKKRLEKLLKGDYKEKLRELRQDDSLGRSKKTYDLSKRIFEEVFDQDAEKEEKRLQEERKKAEAEGEGRKGDKEQSGKGKGKGEGEGDGEGYATSNGKRGKPNGEPIYDKERQKIDYEEWSSDASDFIRHKDLAGGQTISYEGYKSRGGSDYTPCPLKDTTVVNYERKTSNDSRIKPGDEEGGRVRETYEDYYRKLAKTSSDGFANRVRMLLQIRSKGKTQYGTKRGALHPANLYRTTIKDAPGYNERVFKKKIVSDVLDTAVQIIVDDSGSMMGEKYAHAIVAAIHLSNTLGNTLHIPVEILGFTEYSRKNCMFVFREFDTKILSKEALLDRMIHAGRFSNQNADGDSVLFGYHRIKQRKEKRKVMIVLSDGSPAGDRGGDLPGFTKRVVEGIEKSKEVEIIGVGIQDDNVKRYYKDNMKINSPEEIETALLKLIQRKIA